MRRAVVAAVLLVGLAATACASQRPARDTPAPTGPFQPMQVVAVAAHDARHVVVTAQVSGPGPHCATHLVGRVTDSDRHSVFVQLTFHAGPDSSCTGTQNLPVTVAVPPLAGRPLAIDGEPSWVPTSSGRFRQCTGPFGCAGPPRNHCDPAWTRLAGNSGELPPERYYKVRGCDQTWLVVDVDATVTGCQPLDGRSAPSGCRSTSVRWFFRFAAARGWTVVASGNRAGCASVHATVPSFPATLCRRLPPR